MPAIEFLSVTKRYPDGTVAVSSLDLAIEPAEYVCLLGPSGCGKSSTLRMLAGLEEVSEGELRLDGRAINGLPAQRRDMAMVFENYALYPHLNVFDNIAMPLVARGRAASEICTRVARVAEALQISDLLKRYPAQLSGGQRQRVGVGRAIVRRPSTFLLDEPFGHLEAYLRLQLRAEFRRLHERLGTTTLHITHDHEEAAAVSDRIAVIEQGRLQQFGTFLELLDNPVNRFVAEFIGSPPINLLPAQLTGSENGPCVKVGPAKVPLPMARTAGLSQAVASEQLTFGVRPEDVYFDTQDTSETLFGDVVAIEPQGDFSLITVDITVGTIRAMMSSTTILRRGQRVGLRFDVSRAHLFAADGHSLLVPPVRPAGKAR